MKPSPDFKSVSVHDFLILFPLRRKKKKVTPLIITFPKTSSQHLSVTLAISTYALTLFSQSQPLFFSFLILL